MTASLATANKISMYPAAKDTSESEIGNQMTVKLDCMNCDFLYEHDEVWQ